MAKPVTGQTTFGSNTTGTTTQLDNNFLLAYNALNDLNTYSNFLTDTGSANTYVVTLAAGLTGVLTNGLVIQMKAANANTGASTLAYNGGGALNILNLDGSALAAGAIPANAIVQLQYRSSDTVWLLQTPSSVSGASLVLIQTQTANASGNISFTSGISNTYNEYLFTISNAVPSVNDVQLTVRMSEDSGATWKSGASDYAYTNFGASGVTAFQNTSNGANSIVSGVASGNVASDGGVCGEYRLFTPSNTVSKKLLTAQLGSYRSGSVAYVSAQVLGAYIGSANAVNGLQFVFSSGNITSGVFSLYGIRKS